MGSGAEPSQSRFTAVSGPPNAIASSVGFGMGGMALYGQQTQESPPHRTLVSQQRYTSQFARDFGENRPFEGEPYRSTTHSLSPRPTDIVGNRPISGRDLMRLARERVSPDDNLIFQDIWSLGMTTVVLVARLLSEDESFNGLKSSGPYRFCGNDEEDLQELSRLLYSIAFDLRSGRMTQHTQQIGSPARRREMCATPPRSPLREEVDVEREKERVRSEEREAAASHILSERYHSEQIRQGDLTAIKADREKERLLTADIVGGERAAKAHAEKEVTELRHRLEMEEVERRKITEASEFQQIIVKQREELRVRNEQDRQVQLLANAVGPFFNPLLQMQNSTPNPLCSALAVHTTLPETPENSLSTTVSSTS